MERVPAPENEEFERKGTVSAVCQAGKLVSRAHGTPFRVRFGPIRPRPLRRPVQGGLRGRFSDRDRTGPPNDDGNVLWENPAVPTRRSGSGASEQQTRAESRPHRGPHGGPQPGRGRVGRGRCPDLISDDGGIDLIPVRSVRREKMSRNQAAVLGVLVGLSVLLPACFSKPANMAADPARRKEAIEALAANPAARAEVIDRLVGPPEYRAAVIDRILKDESAAGDLVAKIIQQDRGKAIVASKIAADTTAKTFIRMLMLTGVMGESLTQQQADALGMGEPFAYGNQTRTMHDLKVVGAVIDGFAKKQPQEEGRRFPVCYDFASLDTCQIGRAHV